MTTNKYPKIFFLLILLFILLRIPSLFEWLWYVDEGFYATQAEAILRGKELYLEAWDHKPPLMVWIYLFGGVFGWDIGYPLIKVFSIIAGIITIVLLRKLMVKEDITVKIQMYVILLAVFLLGTPILEGNVANTELFFIPITVAILYLSLYYRKAILVGLLLSFTFLIKPQAFIEGVAIISLVAIFDFISVRVDQKNELSKSNDNNTLLRFDSRYYFGLVFTFLGIIGVYFMYLLINNSFYAFLDATFITNFLYIENENGATEWNIFKLVLAFIFFVWILYKIRQGKSPSIGKTGFVISVVIVLDITLVTLSGRPYPHYLIQLVPVMLLGFALFIKNSKFSLKQYFAISLTFVSLVLFLFSRGLDIEVVDRYRLEGHLKYYFDFPQYMLGNTSTHSWFWKKHDYFIPTNALITHFEDNYNGLDYYYYGEQPWIFTQLNGNFVNKYLVWYHLDYSVKKMTEGIEGRDKSMIVIVDDDSRRKRPQFFADLEDKFTFMEQIHNYKIYVNNGK